MPYCNIRDLHEFVFDNPDAVKAVLTDLKSADLGVSVIVSGLIDRVHMCCHDSGLSLHAVEHSLQAGICPLS